ncbi:MAG: hypothetical protein R3F61_36615 [Myxococcota bacterium]
MQKWFVAATLFVALVPALPSPAWAQEEADDRAKQLYENGADLYNEGRYQEAVLAWEEAYRLSDRPKILFNIANAYERMGNIEKALDQLFRYKVYATADQKEQIERRIRMLETRLAEETPAPVPKPDPVPEPSPEPVGPKPVPRPPKEGGGGAPVGAIALLGGGVVALGAGGALGLVSSGAKKSALESCVEVGDSLFCSSEAEGDLKRHRTTAVAADIGFVVGAVAAGTGVVLLATSGGKTKLTAGPNHLRLDGRF